MVLPDDEQFAELVHSLRPIQPYNSRDGDEWSYIKYAYGVLAQQIGVTLRGYVNREHHDTLLFEPVTRVRVSLFQVVDMEPLTRLMVERHFVQRWIEVKQEERRMNYPAKLRGELVHEFTELCINHNHLFVQLAHQTKQFQRLDIAAVRVLDMRLEIIACQPRVNLEAIFARFFPNVDSLRLSEMAAYDTNTNVEYDQRGDAMGYMLPSDAITEAVVAHYRLKKLRALID